jgi:hypothetical protein
MITAGRTVGLASRIQATKKESVAVVWFDVSIQATGTPKFSAAPKFQKIGKINVLLTSSPTVPGDDSKQLNALILSNIVCPINPDKVIAEAPERVQLEGCLDAKDIDILLQ